MSKIDLTQYIPLLHKIAGGFPEEYREDLIQEGFIALHDASKGFNPEMGTPFETFAYKRVRFSMIDFLKGEGLTVSLDNPVEDEEGQETTYADLLVDEDLDIAQSFEDRDYYQKNLDSSTKIEKFIKQRHYEEGLSPQEICDLYSELTYITDVRTIKKILRS